MRSKIYDLTFPHFTATWMFYIKKKKINLQDGVSLRAIVVDVTSIAVKTNWTKRTETHCLILSEQLLTFKRLLLYLIEISPHWEEKPLFSWQKCWNKNSSLNGPTELQQIPSLLLIVVLVRNKKPCSRASTTPGWDFHDCTSTNSNQSYKPNGISIIKIMVTFCKFDSNPLPNITVTKNELT